LPANDYLEFVVQPHTGYVVSYTSFAFRWDRSGTGPTAVTLRSSVDNFASDLGSITGIVSGALVENTITINGLSNIAGPTTFRVYGYGGTGTGGTGGFDSGNGLVPNVVLNGSVASAPAPAIQVTGGPLNFGNQTVNTTSGSLNLTVTNTGTANLVLGTPSFTTGTQFTFVTDPNGTVVTPGNSTTVSFTFTPTSAGAKNDTVLINSNAPGSAPAISLSGTGLEANTPPIAVDDERTTPGNQTLFLTSVNLVANDIDPDPQALAVTAVSNPTNGTVSLDSGNVIFTPTTGYGGTGGFDYTVSDGVDTDTGHVTVTVEPPVGQFSWAADQVDVAENAGSAILTIQRTNGSAGAVDVFWQTEELTANGENDCASGVDFEWRPGVVQFLDGETSKTISVMICDDAVSDPNETFSATLVTTVGGGTIISPSVTTVTITDNEPRTLVVDSTSDLNTMDECSAAANDCSLRGAVAAAQDGDTITFDTAGLGVEALSAATITLGGSAIFIDNDIIIDGPGANLLTISGNNASRVFETSASVVRIDGLTITGGTGSAILVGGGSVTLDGLNVTGNSGTDGGGLRFIGSGVHVVSNSTLTSNQASGAGGGIFGDGGALRLTVEASTISGNSAFDGGGMHLQTNTGEIKINSTTITGNAGTFGSGLVSDGGPITVSNSIIAGNFNGAVVPDVDGSFFNSLGFNLIGNPGFTTGFGVAGDQMGSPGTPIDPKLGPLQNNGGTTPTHALLGGSPAIDKGSTSIGTDAEQFDQRGQPRPVDLPGTANASGGDGSDIGALEMLAPSAGQASISGWVTDANGRAIRGITITVQGMDGVVRRVMTNTFGYYKLDGLSAGESFVVTASARRYAFAAPTQFVNLADNISDLNFTAAR